jgi:hypothetical protein
MERHEFFVQCDTNRRPLVLEDGVITLPDLAVEYRAHLA